MITDYYSQEQTRSKLKQFTINISGFIHSDYCISNTTLISTKLFCFHSFDINVAINVKHIKGLNDFLSSLSILFRRNQFE